MKKILGLAIFSFAIVIGGTIFVCRTINSLQTAYFPQIYVSNQKLGSLTPFTSFDGLVQTNLFSNQLTDFSISNYLTLLKNDLTLGLFYGAKLNIYLQPSFLEEKEVTKTEDSVRFQQIIQDSVKQRLAEKSMGEIMSAIAQNFLGAPYKENLLEQSKEETLIAWLDKFDCILFVETVLAISRNITTQEYSYDAFLDRIRDQRYRNGELNGYCSRLHYFSEWIVDNQKRGTVQSITLAGGITLYKNLNFMSRNRNKYPRMLSNDSNYQCIVESEANLGRVPINYIPTTRIRRAYSQLQSGDIVGVATSINGLDVTHTGLVYRYPNGSIGFIHASPSGTVKIARDLQRYVGNIRNALGIVVVRPNDPRTLKSLRLD